MRRILAWVATLAIGIFALALSLLFALFQSPQAPDSQNAPGKAAQPAPHTLKNRENCNRCHGPGAMVPYPQDHIGLPEDGCTGCHLVP